MGIAACDSPENDRNVWFDSTDELSRNRYGLGEAGFLPDAVLCFRRFPSSNPGRELIDVLLFKVVNLVLVPWSESLFLSLEEVASVVVPNA